MFYKRILATTLFLAVFGFFLVSPSSAFAISGPCKLAQANGVLVEEVCGSGRDEALPRTPRTGDWDWHEAIIEKNLKYSFIFCAIVGVVGVLWNLGIKLGFRAPEVKKLYDTEEKAEETKPLEALKQILILWGVLFVLMVLTDYGSSVPNNWSDTPGLYDDYP
jgi:hypothetical protein